MIDLESAILLVLANLNAHSIEPMKVDLAMEDDKSYAIFTVPAGDAKGFAGNAPVLVDKTTGKLTWISSSTDPAEVTQFMIPVSF